MSTVTGRRTRAASIGPSQIVSSSAMAPAARPSARLSVTSWRTMRAARRAERQADADLAPARERARQLQVRHVHAREQHDETDDGQDDGHDEREHARRLGAAEARSRGVEPHAGRRTDVRLRPSRRPRRPRRAPLRPARASPLAESARTRSRSTGDVRVSGEPLIERRDTTRTAPRTPAADRRCR